MTTTRLGEKKRRKAAEKEKKKLLGWVYASNACYALPRLAHVAAGLVSSSFS